MYLLVRIWDSWTLAASFLKASMLARLLGWDSRKSYWQEISVMRKRLIGVVVLGTATLFLGAVPAHADDASVTTTIVTAPATAATYVEWSSTEVAAPAMTLSRYVEW